MMDLSPDFGINCTFNVENLISYRDTFDTLSNPFVDELTQNLSERSPLTLLLSKLSYAAENIDFILDDQIIYTRDKGTRHYLIK